MGFRGGWGFPQGLVAFVAVGGGDTGQLGEDFEKTAVAGEERAVDSGDDGGGGGRGGILDRGLAAVAAEGLGGGSFDDLGDHSC